MLCGLFGTRSASVFPAKTRPLAIVSPSQIMGFLQAAKAISLGFLTVTVAPADLQGLLPSGEVRFAAEYKATSEPILLTRQFELILFLHAL